MKPEFDVIIVGSGPAGTSAAYPLVKAGLKVLMVDAQANTGSSEPPTRPFLDARSNDAQQWKWMIGENFHALNQPDVVSPKLKTPTHAHVFEGFSAGNRIETDNFIGIGSLATGGLSNAWGCGVARLGASDFAGLPIDYSEMQASYETVARRIGISGRGDDDLSSYFGLDEWAQPPLPLDALHQRLLDHYARRRGAFPDLGFRLGRSRVAVLSQALDERKACDLSGNCLWGCHNQALYNASQELQKLKQYPGFQHVQDFLVDELQKQDGSWTIIDPRSACCWRGTRLLLAAGTLASTRLALKGLNHSAPIPLLSSPTAAFLLWLPKMLGTPRAPALGLGQLSFALALASDATAFGSTFSTTGLPMTEFVSRIPLSKRYSIELLKNLLSACVVGNLFLPGHLSHNTAVLRPDGSLSIHGHEHPELQGLMKAAEAKLRRIYWKMGAILMPMSFTVGRPGADIHYAGTLPMHSTPRIGQTDSLGEVAGLGGVHIVDGACLPSLTEKSHTLTLMANADRISRSLATTIGNQKA
ncbi:Choline dehydrogenase [Pseudomonas sp. NFACC15-1]|uniref:FAD-dependent oxidoreductase n=1 Tax=unclassified Pseudomonas TaxID=196821 RepID=UPI0008857D25|nr:MULTISPECIES: FAD-dependent oxidoreductase [unclassified Pseudomonas]SDA52140.1 Choline dehydrogenase [Pseudomonas sp. NFACC15-1]SDW77213.1 Choline dehydrogenase [Pseudomonas sp. NFACC14]